MCRASGLVRDLAEIGRHQRHVERAAAQPGEVEEVADQPLEPVCLALDHLTGALGRDDAVGEPLGVAADRGQRRLQLVADGEQEGALGVLRAVELLGELVEGGRELAQLGRALDRQLVRALAFRQPAARLGDPRDGPRDGAREQERDDGREDGTDQRGERETDEERLPVVRLVAGRAEQHDRVAAAEAGGVHERLAAHVDGAVRLPGARAARRLPWPGAAAPPAPASGSPADSCSVARKRPSVVSPAGSGFAACWATISSTCRSSALRESWSSERRVSAAPTASITTVDTASVAAIPMKRRARSERGPWSRLTQPPCSRSRAPS